MPGRYLLRRAQSTFNFHPAKKEEKRPCQPERSLSESSISSNLSIQCTTGPSVLRSAINPNWKEKKGRGGSRSNELNNQKKLLQVEETLETEYGIKDDDLEPPFELDETLDIPPPSPSQSILTTPTLSYTANGGMMMTPLEFSTSYSSSCECEVECIDPSLCHSSFISFGSSYKPNTTSTLGSGSRLNSSSMMGRINNSNIQFLDSPNYQAQPQQYPHEVENQEEEEEGSCSWANSPQFTNFSLSNTLARNSSSEYRRRESEDSTYSTGSGCGSDDFGAENDLSNILNGCGSLLDDTPFGNRTPSTLSSSLASSCIISPPSHKPHFQIRGLNIKNLNLSSSSSASSSMTNSPRSDENTIKSIGFHPQPQLQKQVQKINSLPKSIPRSHTCSALSTKLSTIAELE